MLALMFIFDAENAENVGNDVPGNGENAGHVAENARNVNTANLVAENDGQVAETAENVDVGNVVVGNVAIQGQNVVNVVANEVMP
jgi:hypothetical protein